MNKYFTVVASLLVCSVSAWGQGGGASQNTVCRIFFTTPKAGSVTQLEEARKKHFQFHRQHADTWSWVTYQIETGEHTGTYVTSTCGHNWKDFDDWERKMGKEDAADAAAGMGPFSEKTWNSFYTWRGDLSRATPGGEPAPMLAVTIFHLKPGTVATFEGAIKKVDAALDKAGRPKTSSWLELSNGGEGPEFVVTNARQGFAEFAPQAKTLAELLTENGENGQEVMRTISDSIAGQWSEAAVYRPDLSYMGK